MSGVFGVCKINEIKVEKYFGKVHYIDSKEIARVMHLNHAEVVEPIILKHCCLIEKVDGNYEKAFKLCNNRKSWQVSRIGFELIASSLYDVGLIHSPFHAPNITDIDEVMDCQSIYFE